MPKGVKKRGKSRFVNRANRQKNMKKKENRKKLSRSKVAIIKSNWDIFKTARENIQDMGIAFDPNEVVPIVKERREIIDPVPIDGETIDVPVPKKQVTRRNKNVEQAEEVISTLENDAKAEEDAIAAQNRKVQLFHRETELCVYMLARHKDDYQSMARDPKNLWQYTPKQWAKKIKIYKDSEMCKFLESS